MKLSTFRSLLLLFSFTIIGHIGGFCEAPGDNKPPLNTAPDQMVEPATWTFEVSKKAVKVGEEIELIFRATFDDPWYMYATASDFDPECGPLPSEIEFDNTTNFKLVGTFKSLHAEAKYDEVFGCSVKIFHKRAEFRQRIKVTGSPLVISGTVASQICKEVCIIQNADFKFADFVVSGASSTTGAITPTEKIDTTKNTGVETRTPITIDTNQKNKGPQIDESILEAETETGGDSLLGYMILAFVLGLTSLITPCVFPMIPMTVTFFLRDAQSKREGVRKALIFGFSIIAIYTLAGTLFAVLLGTDGLNALSTHWLPNLFVFVIFIVFALSFFGLFEINAPHQLVNKADRQAEKGGLLGIFFMAATLVLVSFSCTIPIVGTALFLTAGGEIIRPIIIMFSYSLAFAIPFTLFAMFPEWIKSLPKSGGWLNSVKVTLGLLELALALKFFSIADQTYHWGILDRDINIGIWIVIFSILGFYLLGKIRMPSDSPVERVTVPRLLMAIATFSFVIYLIPGLWGAPLKALAGYLPPMYTHDFDLLAAKKENTNVGCEEPKYADFLHLPHGLSGYFDYDQALACAREQDKPLFIDFTGHGCTNCREMEANVWADPAVLKRLREDFVIVALYVDDKTELPESAWYTSTYDNKVKRTIGKQNADLQIRNLSNNAQPFYVLVGKDERVLARPKAYEKSVKDFVDFLESGKKTYKRLYGNQPGNPFQK